MAALAGVLVVRYVTFDAPRFVQEVEARLSPVPPQPADAARAAGSASSAPSVSPMIAPGPTDPALRAKQFELTMAELHRRYHTAPGTCFRYPTKEDGAPAAEKADEVADALLAADLTGRFDALMPTSAKWARDADNATHPRSVGAELIDYFASEAGLWTRLGVALRRRAVDDAVGNTFDPPLPPIQGTPLSPAEEARAKPLWERYGHLQLLQGAMKVGARMHVLDLRGAQLRLVEPGMTQDEVRARLGPAEEDGKRWLYPRLGTEVSFGDDGKLIGVASNLAYGDKVIVDGAPQRNLDEASLAKQMGKPIRDAQGDRGETVLVYPAGQHAILLAFAPLLARVELWRKDLVAR